MEIDIFDKKLSSELVVGVSQYLTVEYTRVMLESVKKENIPFTSLVLYDGTPKEKIDYLQDIVDIGVTIKNQVHSLPHIWNVLWGMAKLLKAKYLLFTHSDIEFREGSIKSMLDLAEKFDIVSPIKIDNDREKFDKYIPLYSRPQKIIGFNDSVIIINLEKLKFFPFDYIYSPYQFEISALCYDLWKQGFSSVLDPNAVVFHYCSQDVKFCPEERALGVGLYDKNKERFVKAGGSGEELERKGFLEQCIMNGEIASKIGFPCYLQGGVE